MITWTHAQSYLNGGLFMHEYYTLKYTKDIAIIIIFVIIVIHLSIWCMSNTQMQIWEVIFNRIGFIKK